MIVNTNKLHNLALDYAVAVAEGMKHADGDIFIKDGMVLYRNRSTPWGYFKPSESWNQGGPIIEREEISIRPPRDTFAPNGSKVSSVEDGWFATNYSKFEGETMPNVSRFGETALIAAMRCYVTHKLGNNIDIPEELLEMS